jgi:hypothetical protein
VPAWILVLSPPREWPRPWAFAPFFLARPRRVLVGTDNGGIDHQPFHIRFAGKRREYLVEHADLESAIVTLLNRLKMPKTFGEVTPATA